MFVEDPEDYAQRDVHDADYVWLIDKEYQIQESSIDWVPNPFEADMIHVLNALPVTRKDWSYNHPLAIVD